MGVGVSKMKLNGWDAWMVVVHYDPPGNLNNAFTTNVFPLTKHGRVNRRKKLPKKTKSEF